MKIIDMFDPSTATNGIIETNGVNTNEQLMLYNDSIYALKLTFTDGSIDIIPAAWNKDFIINNIPMGKVKWEIYNTLDANDYPNSIVYGTLYEDGEHVNSANASMQRGFKVIGGNVDVTTQTNSTETLTNNSAPLTTVISITPTDSATPTILIDSSGNVTIKTDNAGVLTQLLKILAGASPGIQLGANGVRTEIIGDLRVQTGAIYGQDGNNTVLVTTGTGSGQVTRIQSGGDIPLQSPAGTTRVTVNSAGLRINNGSLQFQNGNTISNWGDTAGTGTGTVSHNLGVTPHHVSITTHTNGSQTVGYDSETSTTVHVTAAAGLPWFATLMRR